MTARQWILARRPEGQYGPGIFTLQAQPPFEQPLAPGEVEVALRMFLCAPTMRNWMDPPGNSLYPSVPLGDAMWAPAGGRGRSSGWERNGESLEFGKSQHGVAFRNESRLTVAMHSQSLHVQKTVFLSIMSKLVIGSGLTLFFLTFFLLYTIVDNTNTEK